jgi:ribosome-associated protein
VNKVETRVEAVWDLDASPAFTDAQKARIRDELGSRIGANGALRVVSQRHRNQSRNREAAIERLRALVAEALRPRRHRRSTRPTEASRESRMEAKRRRARTKQGRSAKPIAED